MGLRETTLVCCLLMTISAAEWQISHRSELKDPLTEQDAVLPFHSFHNISGRVYYINNLVKVDWLSAMAQCTTLDMTLVSLETEAENTAVMSYMETNGLIFPNSSLRYWTSGHKMSTEWIWAGVGRLFSFTGWQSLEPNEVINPDVCMNIGWMGPFWADNSCLNLYSLMCEF